MGLTTRPHQRYAGKLAPTLRKHKAFRKSRHTTPASAWFMLLWQPATMDIDVMKLITLTALFIAATNVAHAQKPLQSEDLFELEVASETAIAPDGGTIVYVRRSTDIMTDTAVGNLWVIDADGNNHRPLLSGSQNISQPTWSADGTRLLYVARDGDRGAQIHMRWMDSGQTAVLSNLRRTPGSLSWSPNGKFIVFSMFVPTTNDALAKPPKKPKGAKWAPPVKVIESMRYRGDGQGYLESGNTHLFLISSDGGTPQQLTSGRFNHDGGVTFTPDSDTIIFAANRNADWELDPLESDIWSMGIASGEMQQLTNRKGPDFAPTISPDGKSIAYLGFDDRKMGYHTTVAYRMNINGDDQKSLTADFDRSIDAIQWAGSSTRLYVQYADQGLQHIATLSLGGKLTSLANDIGGVSIGRPYVSGSFSVASNGAVAYTVGRPDRPADVGVISRRGIGKRLTDLNDDILGRRDLGNVQMMRWKSSADDLDIQGWLVTPPGFDERRKYPLILEIHGGPFAAYGPHFSAEVQRYAAEGYVVLYTNPRGSTSYGDAFANEIHHAYPGQDYDDLMSGVDAVIARGFVDEDKLYVTGGSGGGVLTAWIVGKTDRFRAAVVAKPVINWISASLTTDISAFMPVYWFADYPWVDPEAYWKRSPLSLVGNVSTPTALLTGEHDYRTPIPESEQYYQALKLRNIDTALIRVPEASHGIAARPSHLIAKIDNILAWFERYRN